MFPFLPAWSNKKCWAILVVLIFFHLLIAFLIYNSLSDDLSHQEESDYLPTVKHKQSVHSGMKNLVADLPNNEVLDHEMNERKIIHQVTPSEVRSDLITELNPADLDFIPTCSVRSSEAISAINRATTQKCKEELVNISCLMQSNKLYPKKLPRFCHLTEGEYGDYVGCFKDAARERSLSGYMVKLPTSNNPKKCTDLCLQSGYVYSGVESGIMCFCGNSIHDLRSKLPKSSCNTTCPTRAVSEKGKLHPTGIKEDRDSFCGGYFAMDIFRTGLKLLEKNEAVLEDMARGVNPKVRIAFIFTVNGRAVRQVKRLVKNLYSSRHFYYFHVDERQEYLYRELLKLESSSASNLKVCKIRYSTIWGGASLLKVLLNSIHDLLTIPDWSNQWDYVINLSESDFPLKSLERLELFLTANKGKNFVKSHGQQTQKFIKKQGLDKTFHECDHHMWKLGERILPTGIILDGGSDWIGLYHDFASYLTYANNTLIRGLRQVFDQTLLPAESFFHTVLVNSEYCDSIINNNLHVTNWQRKLGCNCQYKHVVDWCGCSPNDFTSTDWPKIRNSMSKDLFFGRKFEPVVSQSIINRVENLIQGNANKIITDESYFRYWQNIFDSRDTIPAANDGQMSLFLALAVSSYRSLEHLCSLPIAPISNVSSLDSKLEPTFLIHQVHLFMEEEILKSLLISFNVTGMDQHSNEQIITIESYAKRVDQFQVFRRPEVTKRLIRFDVCSDLDVKEMIFRNYGCILNPFSDIVLLHQWASGPENFTVTLVYIDPTESIIGVFDTLISSQRVNERSHLYFSHKPSFKRPLRPGIWRLVMIFKTKVIAETRFLITPLFYYNMKEVSMDQIKIVNDGPTVATTVTASKILENFPSTIPVKASDLLVEKASDLLVEKASDLPVESSLLSGIEFLENLIGITVESKKTAFRTAVTNSRRIGTDLRHWIESLSAPFWTIRNLCIIKSDEVEVSNNVQVMDGKYYNRLSCDSTRIDSCSATSWSSHFPDVKSQLPFERKQKKR